MVSGKSAEELPPGWKEHVKVTNGRKIKYYTHEERGQKFYSRKRVICFDKMQDCQGTLQSVSEQKQKSNTSRSEVVVEKNDSPEWLPLGWIVESRTRKNGSLAGSVYKTYVDPTTGCKFYSKPQVMKYLGSVNSNSAAEKQKQTQEVSGDKCSKQDVLQNFELIEDKSTISRKVDNDVGKMSLEVVDSSTVLDDLPPGWVKETRARKLDHKRKDPYYIDPVSGYEFRSKKDVLRFLETGDVASCVMKPKKSQVKVEDAICAPMETDGLNLDLVAIDDHGAVSNSTTAALHNSKQPEAERSKETETYYISADSKSTTIDANEDKKNSEVIGRGGSEHSCETKIEGSKLSVKINDDGAVSSTKSSVLHEQKHPEDSLDAKTQIELKKSKKRKPLSVPARFSKRLSGQEPEMLPMMASSERTLRAAVKKSVQKEAKVSMMEQKAAANRLTHQLDTNQQGERIADLPLPCQVASLETEMLNIIEKPSPGQDVEERAVGQVQERREEENPSSGQDVEEQAVGQVQERREEENTRSQDSHGWYPFGDSLSDPCYEFAFKTLTGEIPFEDTLAFQNLFQQPVEASSAHGVVSVGLPEIDTTSLFQNDVPYQLDSVQNTVPADQLPSNSTIQSANINLASCTSFNCQQPSLETRSKDYETKVNS